MNENVLEIDLIPEGARASSVTNAVWIVRPIKPPILGTLIAAFAWPWPSSLPW